MQLPFTREQFFDLFAAYNQTLWPAAAALWIASAVVSALLLSSRPVRGRWISALLVWHWGWSALAYHVAFFTRINPAAWIFATLFLVQAALFFWIGTVQGRLAFEPWRGGWAPLAWGLIFYSLLYPVINVIDHQSLSRIPSFGVPCPTTIFTAGLLMLATPRAWGLSIVPVVWSAIGGSAASLLGVRADYALPIAGMTLVMFLAHGRLSVRGEIEKKKQESRSEDNGDGTDATAMDETTRALRDHLVRLLDWEDAHVGFDKAIDGIPAAMRGARAPGFEHSPWQLLEHLRLAQDDILDFCVNDAYEHTMTWPDDYWPKDPAPPSDNAWSDSIAAFRRSIEDLKRLAREEPDVMATVPTGKGPQTYLRAILLSADHTAYHVGQLVAVRKALGIWPAA